MKIGFYGNANNYPFMLARTLRQQGHDVRFFVVSREKLNRPEHRYSDIGLPYPPWLIDVSHYFRWHCLLPGSARRRVVNELNSCDAVILNEEGPALAGELRVPYAVLLTGSDMETFANPEHVISLKSQLIEHPVWLKRALSYLIPGQFIIRRLINPQRRGVQGARIVAFLPQGLAPGVDRMLVEIGVVAPQRQEMLFVDVELAHYVPPPGHTPLKIFCATRLTWIPGPGLGLTSLDLKGSDIMVRGLAEFWRRTGQRLDIHLVRKGRNVSETEALVRELGLSDQVTWHAEMSQQAVLTMFRDADIAIDQLAQSAVGMAGLDAMATGRPLIANGRPDLLSRIASEPAPILQATTPTEVATHLASLAQSRELREDLGRRSQAYVKNYFSTEYATKVFLKAFANVPIAATL